MVCLGDNMKVNGKTAGKSILKKLPVFVFCVLFISGYNALFGTQNSIVGVVLLMSLLLFLKADFAMDARWSAAMLPVLFVVMGLFAKWSAEQLWLGALLDTAFLGGTLLVCRGDKSRSAYLPFLMGYLMLKGYPVSGTAFTLRMISLASLGTLIGLVHWLGNAKANGSATPGVLLQPMHRSGAWERWALSLWVTLSLTMFGSAFFGLYIQSL